MSLFFLFTFGLTGSEFGWPHVGAGPPCLPQLESTLSEPWCLCECSAETSHLPFTTPQCARLTGLYMRLCVPVCLCGRDHAGLSIDQKGLCVGGQAVEIPTCTAACVCVCWQTFGLWMLLHSVHLRLWSPHCGSPAQFHRCLLFLLWQ